MLRDQVRYTRSKLTIYHETEGDPQLEIHRVFNHLETDGMRNLFF